MENYIINVLKEKEYKYIPITNNDCLKIVYNLFKNDVVIEKIETRSSIVLLYYGYYYEAFSKDIDLMKKYLTLAIDLGNADVMHFLGCYYQKTKEYDLMKKYYEMAIQFNIPRSMCNLGIYYFKNNNVELAVKYWKMAIKLGYSDAMCNVGVYYSKQKEYGLMKKYYLMAISKGNVVATRNFGNYYRMINNFDLMEFYYKSAIKLGDNKSLHNLIEYYDFMKHDYEMSFILYCGCLNKINRKNFIDHIVQMFASRKKLKNDTLIKFSKQTFTKKDKLTFIIRSFHALLNRNLGIIEHHFNYIPNSEGFKEAKKDFTSQLKNYA